MMLTFDHCKAFWTRAHVTQLECPESCITSTVALIALEIIFEPAKIKDLFTFMSFKGL